MNFVVAGVMVLIAMVLLVAMLQARSKEPPEWRALAQRRGLRVEEDRWFKMRLAGHITGFPVLIERLSTRNSSHCVLTAQLPEHMPQLRQTGWFESKDLEVGDAAFDEAFFIGDDATVAMLDAELRGILLAWCDGEGGLDDRKVTWTRPGYYVPLDVVEERLDAVLAIAQAITGRLKIPPVQRLLALVEQDPVERLREHALEILLREHRDDPAVHKRVSALLQGSGSLACMMALAEGDETALLRHATDPELRVELRQAALGRVDPEALERMPGTQQLAPMKGGELTPSDKASEGLHAAEATQPEQDAPE